MAIESFPCIADMKHKDGDKFECCLTGENTASWHGERGRGFESFSKSWFEVVEILAYLREE